MTTTKNFLKKYMVVLLATFLIAAFAVGCAEKIPPSVEEAGNNSSYTAEEIQRIFTSLSWNKRCEIIECIEVTDLEFSKGKECVGAVLFWDYENDQVGIAFVGEQSYYSVGILAEIYPYTTFTYEGNGTVLFYLQTEDGDPYECRVSISISDGGAVHFKVVDELALQSSGTEDESQQSNSGLTSEMTENPVYHVPQAVVDYAYEVGSDEISFWKDESGATKTELTGIENMNSGVAGNDFSVDVYRADFLTTNISSPSAFSTMGKGFYLIALWRPLPEGGGSAFVPLGYVGRGNAYFETEEMLQKYGSPYTAMAENFYHAYLARNGEGGEYPATPGQALEQLCAKGETLDVGHYWRFFGDAEWTQADSAETLSYWRPYLDEHLWIKLASVPEEISACTFTLMSADGTKTLRALLDRELIEFTSEGETTYWMAANNRYHEVADLSRNIYFSNLYAAEIANTSGAVRYGFYEFNFNGRESQLIIETGATEEDRVYHLYGLVQGVLTEIATVDGAYCYLANGVHEYGEQDLVLAGAYGVEEWAYRLKWEGFRAAKAEVILLYRRDVSGDSYTEWPDRIEMYDVSTLQNGIYN